MKPGKRVVKAETINGLDIYVEPEKLKRMSLEGTALELVEDSSVAQAVEENVMHKTESTTVRKLTFTEE